MEIKCDQQKVLDINEFRFSVMCVFFLTHMCNVSDTLGEKSELKLLELQKTSGIRLKVPLASAV